MGTYIYILYINMLKNFVTKEWTQSCRTHPPSAIHWCNSMFPISPAASEMTPVPKDDNWPGWSSGHLASPKTMFPQTNIPQTLSHSVKSETNLNPNTVPLNRQSSKRFNWKSDSQSIMSICLICCTCFICSFIPSSPPRSAMSGEISFYRHRRPKKCCKNCMIHRLEI